MLSEGYVVDIDALALGVVCGSLGASRTRASDIILPAVGMELLVTKGQLISKGQSWLRLHHENRQLAPAVCCQIEKAITVGFASPDTPTTRILQVIE